jgi:DNA-binding winged helix-turn-helix (wHTH) protein/Tol biopolymer transport system component
MKEKTKQLYAFGPFRVHAAEYLLTVDGKPLPLSPKAFEALLMLVENAGHLVDKNELMRRVWPDTFVEDGNLAKHVSLLRKALSEASDGQEYIETIPKRGYRFVAEVTVPADSASSLPPATSATTRFDERAAAEMAPALTKGPTSYWLAIIACALLAVAAGVVWVMTHGKPTAPEIRFRQLTASSTDDPIRYGAISPDGKYLAYADLKGIHVMLLKSGEAQTVPASSEFRGARVDWQFFRWFPDGTRFLVNQNPPDERSYGYSATIWIVPVVGGPPRKLRADAGVESISPDGTLVAFTTDTHNLWLMNANGEQVRKLYSLEPDVWNFRFSPNGERLMYTDYSTGDLESRDLHNGGPVKAMAAMGNRLRDYLWLPDGKVVYALTEPSPNLNTCNLWQQRVDAHTGEPQGKPQRLTNWIGSCAENLSATADGKMIAFQQWTAHATVYVAGVETDGTHITTPVRLTDNERENIPTGWTADSKAVVYKSTLNGETGIYAQRLGEDTTEPIVTSVSNVFDHTPLSPDGAWLLYDTQPGPGETHNQLMRSPTGGGTAQVALTEAGRGVRCAHPPSSLCVMAEPGSGSSFTFIKFDPLKGRGTEIAQINIDPESDFFWDLSPDGRRIAVLEGLSGQIHILSLTGEASRVINANGMQTTEFINWTADGKAVLVSRPTHQGFELLRLELNGDVHVLWEEKGCLGTSALPSPDGKHLAIRGWSVTSNFWTMSNF